MKGSFAISRLALIVAAAAVMLVGSLAVYGGGDVAAKGPPDSKGPAPSAQAPKPQFDFGALD